MAKIRQHGEGTYYKQSNGTWQYKITVGKNDDGKLIRKTFYGSSGLEAKTKADKWKKQNSENFYTVSPDTKLMDWLNMWLLNTKKGTMQESSYKHLEIITTYIPNKLKNKKVSAISPIELQSVLNGFSKDRSKSYADKMCTLLRSCFSAAYDNGLCSKNPASKLTNPNKYQPQREAFTPDEVSNIIEFALNYQQDKNHPKHKATGQLFGTAIITLLFTGLRRGELLGLQWSDLTENRISVNRAVYIDSGSPSVTDNKAKTEGSIRDIPIPEFLYILMQRLPKNGLFIFCTNTGKLIHPKNFSRSYNTFFEHLHVRYPKTRHLSPHCCRHTYATLTLSGGADIRVVQTLMGHTNINTTAIYTHPDFVAKQSALDGMIKLISKDTTQDNEVKKALKSSQKAK